MKSSKPKPDAFSINQELLNLEELKAIIGGDSGDPPADPPPDNDPKPPSDPN